MFKKFDDDLIGDIGVVLKKPESDQRRVLLQAAAILEENGWCQHQLMKRPCKAQLIFGAKTQYCAWGALYAADNHFTLGTCAGGASPEVLGAVNALERVTVLGLADWNDEQGRTKDEVIDLMRSVAATL